MFDDKNPSDLLCDVFLLCVFAQVHGQHCIWYGECGNSPKRPEKKLNCNYTGPAVPLPGEGQELLQVRQPVFTPADRWRIGNGD